MKLLILIIFLGKIESKRSKKPRKLFFPGFAYLISKAPSLFEIETNQFGDISGGNISITLPNYDNPPVINSFETKVNLRNSPKNIIENFPQKIQKKHKIINI